MAAFFDPADPASLADVLADHAPAPDARREDMARDGLARSHRDAAAFAKAFVDLIAARAA